VIFGARRRSYAVVGVVALSVVLAAVLAVPALAETKEFENTTALQIPADGPASIYPSSIDVSGMSGPDTEATVTLHGLSHENIKDLAVLLVGPGGGRGVVLMASYDLSHSGSFPVSNVNLTFKDEGEPVECSLREGLLPNFPGSEGAYGPFNCGLVAPFPAPAPQEPYGYGLEAEETDGVWSLYVDNDTGDQEGRIAGGWSLHITTVGSSAPTDTALPSITGTGEVGQTLSCSEGSWIDGFASVSFGYQWLRDGSPIAGASASTYAVQAADRGHTLTCEVTASNSAGDSAATSAGVAIPAGSSGGDPSGGSQSDGSPSGSRPIMGVTSTQIAALLAGQLTPSGKAAKIAALLRRGECTAAFEALESGTAAIDWYAVPPGAQRARDTKAKPILIASGGRTFAAAGTATIKIKLTAVGKSVLKHAKRIKLTALSTFTPTGKAPITATRTFVLKQ
jgi:subtilisin-like proprotein convertase family protein